MKKMMIPVKPNVTKAWENAPDGELRAEITEMLELQVAQLVISGSNRKHVLEYFRLLQEEMKNNRLSQEILDEILE